MSSAEWFLLLEKKVYTSTGGTVGGHSTEERLLTLFIIEFYVAAVFQCKQSWPGGGRSTLCWGSKPSADRRRL